MSDKQSSPNRRRIKLFFLFIIALIVFAAILKPKLDATGIGYSDEVRDFREQLVTMDAPLLDSLVHNAGNRPTLLLIYASWCPYCKQQIEALEVLRHRFDKDRLQILYVSFDQKPYALSKFLIERPSTEDFTPFHVPSKKAWEFISHVNEKYATTIDGSVPHTVIFDQDGKPVEELLGFVSTYRLQQILSPLASKPQADEKPN